MSWARKIYYKQAVLWMIGAALCLSLMSLCVYLLSDSFSCWELVFYRSLINAIFVGFLLYKNKLSLRTPYSGALLLRSLFGFLALGCYFKALSLLPFAKAVFLTYTVPLFTALLAFWLLKERSVLKRSPYLLTSLLGVFLITQPYLGIDRGTFLGLLSALLAALAYITIRHLKGKVHAFVIIFYFTLISTLLSGGLILVQGGFHVLPHKIPLLLCLGLTASLGQHLITLAYLRAPASYISQFSYLTLLFASLWTWLFLKEELTGDIFIGGVLIAGSAALNARRKRSIKK